MDRNLFYGSLPLELRWKWCRSSVEIGGEKVEAVRLDMEDDELVAKAISELKSRFSEGMPAVGIYFMRLEGSKFLLVLCVKPLCIFLEVSEYYDPVYICRKLFSDESIFFSGFDVQWETNYSALLKFSVNITGKGCDIRQVAANVLNRESLAECVGLAELAGQIGYGELKKSDELKIVPSDCKATMFSEKEMKKALHSAYHSYHIAVKMLSMV